MTVTDPSPPTAWPYPVPFGWFAAGFADELAAGAVETRHLVGRELVLFRDADGAPHVLDAYCPHLGAHLGIGGCVEGGTLVCPFHGWAFDGDGVNVEIPYSERTNGKARIRSYPTVERNGLILFWYHPDPDVAPRWEIPELEFLHGQELDARSEWTVQVAMQEIGENAVDGAHFQYVHGTTQVGEVIEADFSGDVRHQRVAVRYNTKHGTIDGWQQSDTWGPGFGVTQFHIFGDAYLVAANTPIDATRTHVRFAWAYADDDISRRTGAKFAEEVVRQFAQDIPIWEHKRFIAEPALAPSEKAITQYRKWASRFYA